MLHLPAEATDLSNIFTLVDKLGIGLDQANEFFAIRGDLPGFC